MYTIDIDVGGTLTDGLFGDGQRVAAAKVDTTPHDLTVCFRDCLQAGAAELGFADLGDFLAQTGLIRWSTTITTNALAERRGPRLGLFVSAGQEQSLYSGNGGSPALELLGEGNIIGLSQPVDPQAVLGLVKNLLERGVRRMCISLAGAFSDPADEEKIKAAIECQYPDHYLGSVPVLLGSDICKHPDDMTRTHYALINAYVHGPLADTLFKAEDQLRAEFGWKRQLLIGHQSGGVARVAKTRAVDTIESGPTMGLFASAEFARRYGLDRVVILDVGGTTAKVSVIKNRTLALNYAPEVFGIPLKMPMPDVHSIALGGGSIASVKTGPVNLGPESMGAYPGPACYDLGGTEATFTDAALVLGYLNADNFLGGTRYLNVDSARQAIQTHVAGPLGLDVTEAAARIVERAFGMAAEVIKKQLAQAGVAAKDATLFSYGGNGSLVATGVAEKAGLKDAYVFNLGSVFSVLGSSMADIMHVYDHAVHVAPDAAGVAKLNETLAESRQTVLRDMEGEGLDPAQVQLSIEVDTRNPAGEMSTATVLSDGDLTVENLKAAGVTGKIELLRLRATYRVSHHEIESLELGDTDAGAAKIDTRAVGWAGAESDTAVYSWESLEPGHEVAGPAVIEARNTTYLVGPGWQLGKDEFSNGHLTRK